jgi:hypothetical protein
MSFITIAKRIHDKQLDAFPSPKEPPKKKGFVGNNKIGFIQNPMRALYPNYSQNNR